MEGPLRMKDKKKYIIYILTNPAMPDYVKIGTTSNIDQRLKSLSAKTSVPHPFRLYAYYVVFRPSQDKILHALIDELNPDLRCKDLVNGKVHRREFYQISKERAFNLLQRIATISNTENRLHLEEETTPRNAKEVSIVDRTKYNIADYLSDKSANVVRLYYLLLQAINKKLPEAYAEATPNYIALRNKTGHNICELHLQKKRILINSRIPTNPQLLKGKKVPDNYFWTLNYQTQITEASNIDSAVEIAVDSYRQMTI